MISCLQFNALRDCNINHVHQQKHKYKNYSFILFNMVLDFSRNFILMKLSENTKCKVLIYFFIILLLEGGLRVCNDAILLDFSVVLREFFFQVAVLWFYKTKQFVVFGIFGEF